VERWVAASWLAPVPEVARRWSRIRTLGWFSPTTSRRAQETDEVNRGLLDRFGRKRPAYYAYKRG
jgi:hypothetical protein